ncbi:hypothetical protein IFM89_036612 [Coptis chinensis]|uniref:Uncharacterized protein n=1 Tax=Coptis chinensis TaxID=261450 RepID=A0A835HJ69_9MAGN|nr:hypothetical protein IFM89_036612 [Coptis chinensis]
MKLEKLLKSMELLESGDTVSGFPTLLFFPIGHNSTNPINLEAGHTVVGLYKFLKKHAQIPFKLQRPT